MKSKIWDKDVITAFTIGYSIDEIEFFDNECEEFLTVRGKGWVCEIENEIVGFSIVDLKDHNIWALFLRPEFEKKGIGRKLHDIMLDWYFEQTKTNVWLGTSPFTRAETFYRKAGWKEIGTHGKDEIKFEMTFEEKFDVTLINDNLKDSLNKAQKLVDDFIKE